MEMSQELNRIRRGDLNDPYKEFMIQEDSTISRDALTDDFNAQYWESRYTLRGRSSRCDFPSSFDYPFVVKAIPKMLRDQAYKALIAGKYLNVVRGCLREIYDSGKDSDHLNASGDHWTSELRLPPQRELSLDFSVGMNSLATVIHEAYNFSSRALLRLLQEGHGINHHFRSLRRFFLLENGDFFIQFMGPFCSIIIRIF